MEDARDDDFDVHICKSMYINMFYVYESNSAIDVQNLVAFLFGFYLKATKTS